MPRLWLRSNQLPALCNRNAANKAGVHKLIGELRQHGALWSRRTLVGVWHQDRGRALGLMRRHCPEVADELRAFLLVGVRLRQRVPRDVVGLVLDKIVEGYAKGGEA